MDDLAGDEQLDPLIAQMVDEVVDDLTKYNVLAFIYEQRRFEGNLAALAQRIGLRPSQYFAQAVESLAVTGLIVTTAVDGGAAVYLPADDLERQKVVVRLLALPADSPQFALLMRRLTARSLRRMARPLFEDL